MRNFIIKKLGGYPSIKEAIDDIREQEDKHRILSLAVKDLFNTIGPEDILKQDVDGKWLFGNKVLSKGQVDAIKGDVKYLLTSMLWKVLQKDVKHQANRKMYILGKTDLDFIAGKMFLYTLDAIKTRLNSIEKGSGNYSSNR